MELKFSRIEKTVGLFMTVIVLLTVVTVVLIGRGQDWFREYVTYYTVFKESYNLQVGAPVKLFKTDVGKVKRITLDGDKVRVELAILGDYANRIRKDTVAVVDSPTIIGSEYVNIKPGSPESPVIPHGGEIRSEAKKSIDDILQEFEIEETARRLVKALQDISDIVEELRDPEGPLFSSLKSVDASLKDLKAITDQIRRGEGTVGGLVMSDELLEKVNEAMDKTNEAMDKVDQILTNVEQGSRDVPAITRSTRRGLEETRDTVREIDRAVKAAQKSVLLRRDLPPAPEGKDVDAGLRR